MWHTFLFYTQKMLSTLLDTHFFFHGQITNLAFDPTFHAWTRSCENVNLCIVGDTAKLSTHCSKLSQCRCTTYTGHFHYVDPSRYLLLGSYFTYRSYNCYNPYFLGCNTFQIVFKKISLLNQATF